jgi:hypothetical protein
MNTKEVTVSDKNQQEQWKFLTFREDKIVSLVGLQLGAVCELLPLYYSQNKLCPIGELAKIMLGGNYPTNRDKIRTWWPSAVKRARQHGIFLVGDGRPNRNGKLMNVGLCPPNPPQYLRTLAEAQIVQQINRRDISAATAERLLQYLNGNAAIPAK